MSVNQILEKTVPEWSFWEQQPPASVPRSLLARNVQLSPDLVTAIQGVRRCGKSTFMVQMAEALGTLGNPRAVFLNFEDPRLADTLSTDLLDDLVKFARCKVGPNDTITFFLDEIQTVPRWEKWLHVQTARPGKNTFVVTGSNASLLEGELATALTGRHHTLELFPFSFEEFRKVFPEGTLTEYFAKGGFPRFLAPGAPASMLREYFTDIVERDVRRHVAARSSVPLAQVAKTIFESTGSEMSFRKIAASFGTTPDTVRIYIEALTAAYLILPCPYFTFSERKRVVRPVKYYPIDLGMRAAIVTRTGIDTGKNFEAAVFHLLRRNYSEVYYWRDKGEVDFVLQTRRGVLPLQVTSAASPEERHLAALDEFARAHPQSLPGKIITMKDAEAVLLGRADWLLDPP